MSDELHDKRLLVCGGRDYSDYARVLHFIKSLRPTVVIHGDYRGADKLADRAARSLGIPVEPYPALWADYGPSAGPLRNQEMIDEGKPDVCLAFPGDKGTADMVTRAKAAGLRVIEVRP